MTWRIATWNHALKTGTVISAHIGPLSFGWGENPSGALDFEVNEPVLVSVDPDGRGWRIRTVIPAYERQPEGTLIPEFSGLNEQHHSDMHVEYQSETELRLWVGDCCVHCCPGMRVSFIGVSLVDGLDDESSFDSPLFRLASKEELEARAIQPGDGERAFCVVTDHGQRPGGPKTIVVAQGARVDVPD